MTRQCTPEYVERQRLNEEDIVDLGFRGLKSNGTKTHAKDFIVNYFVGLAALALPALRFPLK